MLVKNGFEVVSITRGNSQPYEDDYAWKDVESVFLDSSKFEADANKYKFVWKPTKDHQKLSDKIRIILSKYEFSRNVPETGIIPATTIADKITKFNNLISNIDISCLLYTSRCV